MEKEFSQPECEIGISVPGAFKLDDLQPVKLILSQTIFPILDFLWVRDSQNLLSDCRGIARWLCDLARMDGWKHALVIDNLNDFIDISDTAAF